MRVFELINLLQEMPQNSLVILQKDAEGNGFSPLYGADPNAVYEAATTWYGEVRSTEWTASDAGMEEEEWEEYKRRTPACVVLYPVN